MTCHRCLKKFIQSMWVSEGLLSKNYLSGSLWREGLGRIALGCTLKKKKRSSECSWRLYQLCHGDLRFMHLGFPEVLVSHIWFGKQVLKLVPFSKVETRADSRWCFRMKEVLYQWPDSFPGSPPRGISYSGGDHLLWRGPLQLFPGHLLAVGLAAVVSHK